MAREFAKGFYHSVAWKHARAAYMALPVTAQDGRICPPGMCERCFSRGQLKPAEIVHHRVHLTPANVRDRAIALDFSNLMRVCRDCHAELHSPEGAAPRVEFDEYGRVVPR